MRSPVVVVLLASGCSVFFDPARVPASDCPSSATRCPPRANAEATCDQTECSYSCVEGARDADGLAENGCEVTCAPIASPASLASISGPAATSVRWQFPPAADAVAYRLCTSVSAAARTCTTVPASACRDGLCEAETGGLPPQTLVFGQVQSLNACQSASAESSAPLAEGLTLSTTALTAATHEGLCAPPTVTTTADTLAIAHEGGCVSTVSNAEERWRDATFDVDVRFAGAMAVEGMAGLLLTSGSRRLSITTGTSSISGIDAPTQIRESLGSGAWSTRASSIAAVGADSFQTLRVIVQGSTFSVNLGPVGGPFKEVIRWRDEAAPAPRRVGLAVWTNRAARAEFRALTVRTTARLPAVQGSSRSWTFLPDGGSSSEARVVRTFGNEVRFDVCPAFPTTPDCQGCAPTRTGCVRVVKPFLFPGSLSVDPPVGLDTTRPWSFTLRFAAPSDGGAPAGPILAGGSGTITDVRTSWNDGGTVTTFERAWPARGGIALDQWHLLEHTVDPSAQTFSVRLDGQPVPLSNALFPPRTLDRHLGAFTVGSGPFSVLDVWVNEITISQP